MSLAIARFLFRYTIVVGGRICRTAGVSKPRCAELDGCKARHAYEYADGDTYRSGNSAVDKERAGVQPAPYINGSAPHILLLIEQQSLAGNGLVASLCVVNGTFIENAVLLLDNLFYFDYSFVFGIYKHG